MPRWSVIIPAYQEAATIGRCLEAISRAARQAGQEPELIVMDDGSTDRTAEIARAAGARVEILDRVPIAELRNRGAALAKGEILLFVDADMEVPPTWFEALVAWFAPAAESAMPPVDALGFADIAPAEAPAFARDWSARALARWSTSTATDYLPGRNLAIRRAVFDKVGGFDASLRTAEDKDLTLRLVKNGARVLWVPDPVLIHHGYERTLTEWMRKEFWRQGSHLALLQRHGQRPRLLRMPLLGLAHLVWGAVVVLALVSLSLETVVLALLWLAPAMIQAALLSLEEDRWRRTLRIGVLVWLRYILTGLAVFSEALGDGPGAAARTDKAEAA